MNISLLIVLSWLIVLNACDNKKSEGINSLSKSSSRGEYIYRKHDEFRFQPPLPEKQTLPIYPWSRLDGLPPITKAHFRCKGNHSHPPIKIEQQGQTRYILDCGGCEDHSLPLCDGKEYICPILIDLLNYVQQKTQRCVQITSGHRCPEHHLYVDSRPKQQSSKHQIGAEVTFYVEGWEQQAEQIIALLQSYYQETACYSGLKDYQEFARWDKDESDVRIFPWYNKEIFIKLYQKDEGRNLDNDHQFPYISIQVRYDRQRQERVIYSWEKAFRGYYRY